MSLESKTPGYCLDAAEKGHETEVEGYLNQCEKAEDLVKLLYASSGYATPFLQSFRKGHMNTMVVINSAVNRLAGTDDYWFEIMTHLLSGEDDLDYLQQCWRDVAKDDKNNAAVAAYLRLLSEFPATSEIHQKIAPALLVGVNQAISNHQYDILGSFLFYIVTPNANEEVVKNILLTGENVNRQNIFGAACAGKGDIMLAEYALIFSYQIGGETLLQEVTSTPPENGSRNAMDWAESSNNPQIQKMYDYIKKHGPLGYIKHRNAQENDIIHLPCRLVNKIGQIASHFLGLSPDH